jgi:hypothetical protein
MRKCLTLVKSREERSKNGRVSPELEAFLASRLSLVFLFNAAAPLLLGISPRAKRREEPLY